jgi:hypothetical protein
VNSFDAGGGRSATILIGEFKETNCVSEKRNNTSRQQSIFLLHTGGEKAARESGENGTPELEQLCSYRGS